MSADNDILNFDVPTIDDELERAKKEFAQSFKTEDVLADPELATCSDELSSPIIVKKKLKFKIHDFLSRLKYVLGL